jgi:hypothetical protein
MYVQDLRKEAKKLNQNKYVAYKKAYVMMETKKIKKPEQKNASCYKMYKKWLSEK